MEDEKKSINTKISSMLVATKAEIPIPNHTVIATMRKAVFMPIINWVSIGKRRRSYCS